MLALDFINIGNGDCILIREMEGTQQKFAMMVDFGHDCLIRDDHPGELDPRSQRIYAGDFLRELGVTHLDVALATHFHRDHIGGLGRVLDVVTIDRFYTTYLPPENAPKLDGITFYLLGDESARLAALRTGDINLCSLSAMNLADVERDANIKVISYQSNDYTYLGFNLSSEKLQDKRVRQAMSLAVDRDMIIDYVYNGEATVSTFVAPAMGHWVWDAAKESPLYTQNIEEARKLMEEAGYSKDNRLSITMAAGLLDSIRDTAVVLQQQLKEIYIDVTISNLESGEYVDIWKKMSTPEAGFDTMCGQNGSGTDPNRAVSFFYSSTGNANVWGYKNDRVDELCALGITTTDEETREGYYKEAQQLIIDECPNLWFASPMSSEARITSRRARKRGSSPPASMRAR